MRKSGKIGALVIVLPILSACADTTNADLGRIIGAVGGGYLGSQFGSGGGKTAATIFGAVLGSYLGGKMGERLDARDYEKMEATTYEALDQAPNGETRSWVNEESGASGTVTPHETYRTADGTDCREFTQTVSIENDRESATGVACRQADGSWRIVG